MNGPLSQVEFYFPDPAEISPDKEGLADLIVSMMKEQDSIAYSGHADEKSLRRGIAQYLGDGDVSGYKNISHGQREQIRITIEETIQRCDVVLPVPAKNYVFVFPWFPTKKDAPFKGVMGVAWYSCVFHVFLAPDVWSPEVLANTVIHELNHTIYYYRHYDSFGSYDALDQVIMEGLAENFVERLTGQPSGPWATAVPREEALALLRSHGEGDLSSKDPEHIKKFLFGGGATYKRWAGYAAGYWMVKEFMERNPDVSWEELMEMSSGGILEEILK